MNGLTRAVAVALQTALRDLGWSVDLVEGLGMGRWNVVVVGKSSKAIIPL